MQDETFRILESRWREAFAEYVRLKEAAFAQVVRREWATHDRYDSRPLYYKRHPGRGRVVKKPPEDTAHMLTEYGFDEVGRVMVMRCHHPLYPPIETFYRYADDLEEMVTFSAVTGKAIPGQVERVYYARNRIERYASFKLNGFGPGPDYRGQRTPDAVLKLMQKTIGIIREYETYEYEGKRVVRIETYSEGYGPKPVRSESRIAYDERGNVDQITLLVGENYSKIIYRKPRQGQTLKSLAEAVRLRLIDAIPRVIAGAGFQEPLYCITLWYRGVDYYFPPIITPGLESRRHAILRDYPRDSWWQVWSVPITPDRPFPPYPITDPDTIEACERLEHAVHSRDAWEFGRKTLREIARALTRRDWSGIIKVTPDFVVFAMEPEFDTLESALSASVSRAQLKAWKAQGLL